MIGDVDFIEIDWRNRPVTIEYRWIEGSAAQPLIIFLHEGLGSLAMWKDFPQQLCLTTQCRGLVYSRPGYGASSPRPAQQKWGTDFMHQQARELLPLLLDALGVDSIDQPPWLFGHSDGASIALLFAAEFPAQAAGVIALAPHIMVEEISITSIELARKAYLEADLKARLARYHADPDSAFWGWNDIWLSPAFRDWSIESDIGAIECPLLAVQGIDDEYGTLQQVDGIVQRVAHTRVIKLPDCGHSPHRDQPVELLQRVAEFINEAIGLMRFPAAGVSS